MWLYLPETTSHSLPVPPASILLSPLSEALSAAVMSRSALKQPKFWLQGLKKDRWTMLQYGAMLLTSQQNSIVETYLESVVAGPVLRSALQDSEKEQKTHDGSGHKSSECYARLTPNGSWEKMSQAYYLPTMEEHLGMSCGTWPTSGSMLNGCVFERPTWEPPTGVTASGSWPTARAEDSESCGNHPGATDSLTGASRNWYTPTCQSAKHGEVSPAEMKREAIHVQAAQWHTPSTVDHKTDGPKVEGRYGTPEMKTSDQRLRNQVDFLLNKQDNWLTPHGMNGTDHTGKQGRGGEFAKQATEWPTPGVPNGGRSMSQEDVEAKGNCADGKKQVPLESMTRFCPTPDTSNTNGERQEDGKRNTGLNTHAAQWQTPATDSFRSRGGERKEEMGLDQQTRFWPTPRTITGGGESAERKQELEHKNGNGAGMPLAIATLNFPCSPQDPEPETSGSASSEIIPTWPLPSQRRKLNPSFVEILMGAPLGWTSKTARIDSERLEIWFHLCRQALRSLCLPGD